MINEIHTQLIRLLASWVHAFNPSARRQTPGDEVIIVQAGWAIWWGNKAMRYKVNYPGLKRSRSKLQCWSVVELGLWINTALHPGQHSEAHLSHIRDYLCTQKAHLRPVPQSHWWNEFPQQGSFHCWLNQTGWTTASCESRVSAPFSRQDTGATASGFHKASGHPNSGWQACEKKASPTETSAAGRPYTVSSQNRAHHAFRMAELLQGRGSTKLRATTGALAVIIPFTFSSKGNLRVLIQNENILKEGRFFLKRTKPFF